VQRHGVREALLAALAAKGHRYEGLLRGGRCGRGRRHQLGQGT
jgi:hypothetical protein